MTAHVSRTIYDAKKDEFLLTFAETKRARKLLQAGTETLMQITAEYRLRTDAATRRAEELQTEYERIAAQYDALTGRENKL